MYAEEGKWHGINWPWEQNDLGDLLNPFLIFPIQWHNWSDAVLFLCTYSESVVQTSDLPSIKGLKDHVKKDIYTHESSFQGSQTLIWILLM